MLAHFERSPFPILLFHWCLSISQRMREKNRKSAKSKGVGPDRLPNPGPHTQGTSKATELAPAITVPRTHTQIHTTTYIHVHAYWGVVRIWRIHRKYMGNLKTITLFNLAKPHDSKVHIAYTHMHAHTLNTHTGPHARTHLTHTTHTHTHECAHTYIHTQDRTHIHTCT